jgi:uncharacterized coiled-coil DUF342 family protein
MSVREPEAVREHIDSLQHQVTELKESVEQGRREKSQQLTARIEQIKAAISRQTDSASDGAGQAADRSQKQWQGDEGRPGGENA